MNAAHLHLLINHLEVLVLVISGGRALNGVELIRRRALDQ